MATAVADNYTAASGGAIYAGRNAYLTNRNWVVIGDSLTERAFGSTPIYHQLGMVGAPVLLYGNSGFSGQSVFGLIGQIENSYTLATAPGMIGYPALGVVGLRIGTNTVRGSAGSTGVPITDTTKTHYQTIISRLKDFAEHIVIFPVPPIGGSSIGKNTSIAGYNDYLQTLVAGDSRLHWIDDCTDLVDASGNIKPEFFISDELHMNGAGGYQMALTAKTQMQSLMASLYGPGWFVDPCVTNPADVYPAQPQWTTNPTNVGTGGTKGSGWTGTLPDGWNVSSNGAGAGGTVEIVSATGGDTNTVPWVSITPTSAGAGSAIAITMTAAGRSITDTDPARLEQIVQVRGNNFTVYEDLTCWIQVPGGTRLTPNLRGRWGATIGHNTTETLRQSWFRTTTTTGTPTNYIYIASSTAFTGSMGSIDLRCWSVRG